MLFEYQQQTQRLIGDLNQQKIAPNDLTYYINTARRHVAELTQCCRVLTPNSASITSITVTNNGTGYTATPTITVSSPDMPSGAQPSPVGIQATAVPHISGGTFTSITLSNPGTGYFYPVVSITDSTGLHATAVASISTVTTTVQGQEVYNFSTMPLNSPGISAIFAIKSVAIVYNNFRYILPCYSFSTYQAFVRNYPTQYQYVPTVCSQYGQGENGTLYMYPLPSTAYPFQIDGFGIPNNLAADSDIEAIPLPWTDSVPYYAAYLAFLQLQKPNEARGMLDLFDKMLLRQSTSARPGRATNPYGRW